MKELQVDLQDLTSVEVVFGATEEDSF